MKIALATIIVLSSTCFVGVLSSCHSGPGSCFVSWLTCPWPRTSGWSVFSKASFTGYNSFLGLFRKHNHTEIIQSRTVCSTNNKIHCLNFQYSFEENNVFDLSVFVRSKLGEREVWKMSSSTDFDTWDDASVPVNTSTDFQLIFKAKGSRYYVVDITRVYYVKQACNIMPTAATPSPVTTTVKSSTTEYPVHTSDSTPSGDIPTTPSQAGGTAPGGSSSNLGLIVGGVVAAVCLILIGLVLAILLKRKRRGEGGTCFRRQKPKEENFHVSSSHNAAFNPDETEPNQYVNMNENPVIPPSKIQHREHDVTVTPSSPNNHYSVIDDSSGYSYVDLNELQNSNHGKLQRYHQGSDESPYEIKDSSENIPPVPASPDDDYNKLNVHTSTHSDSIDRSGTSGNQNSDYNHLTSKTPEQDSDLAGEDPSADVYTLPKGATSDQEDKQNRPVSEGHNVEDIYHVLEEQTSSTLDPDSSETSSKAKDYQHLDFEGNRIPKQRGDDEPAPVYSHLHGWDEGDYHQIDRGRRREVIDGDYSHM